MPTTKDPSSPRWIAIALLSTLSVLHLCGCNRSTPATQVKNGAAAVTVKPVGRYRIQPFEVPKAVNPGYVGYQKCAECHAARVKECEPTSHFQTCRVPTADRMPENFVSTNLADRTLQLPNSDVVFEMSQRDGKYFQRATQAGKSSGVESTIDLVYGAKSISDEVYLSWHADDSMWELPVAWVWANNSWGAAAFDRRQGGDFARQLTVRCFECHTTWFQHVPGTVSTYRRDELLLGVTCERCHGPGKAHVDYHHNNPQEKKASAIVLPGALDRERLIDVCTQCHSNAVNHKGPANSFRSGGRLEDHYRTVTPATNETDRVANQVVHLRESKCFQESKMTCITCHDPHITGNAPHGMTSKDTCLQCHQVQSCRQREKTPPEIADKCVECHMRQYAKINVNFAQANDTFVPPLRRTNHRIQIDPIANDEVLLEWYRTRDDDPSRQMAAQLESRLLEHWKADGQERAKEGRFVAAVSAMRESLRISPNHEESKESLQQYIAQQQELDELRAQANAARSKDVDQSIALFQKVLTVRPNDAGAHGRLGTLYAQLGDREKATTYLSKVAELDPDDQYGLSMLGWLAFLDSDFKRAAEYYEQADAIEPFSSKINFLWGSSLARLGRDQDAQQRLQIAIKSDPKNLDAMRELIDVSLRLNEFQAAAEVAEQAVRLTQHRSLRELMVLAQCHVNLNDKPLAGEIVALAIQAAQGNPADIAKITQWCQENKVELAQEARH
ncbi:MAG: tetratricopeptide repeat protein [Pirellulaceae bacterium]|nr:tetratricopeptide repeat protein [Pirellulaceae bacterium]